MVHVAAARAAGRDSQGSAGAKRRPEEAAGAGREDHDEKESGREDCVIIREEKEDDKEEVRDSAEIEDGRATEVGDAPIDQSEAEGDAPDWRTLIVGVARPSVDRPA